MCRGINKLLIIGGLLFAVASCGDGAKDEALKLYEQSAKEIENHNYAGALVLLDTLNSRYAVQTAVRRDGLRLRAMAMEGIAADSISSADRALAEATLRLEAIAPKFRHVDSSVGLEGYFLPVGVSEEMLNANAIQPRVTDKGYFYIVANVQGKVIGLRAISLVDGADDMTSAEISQGRVINVEGSEIASFSPEEVDGLAPWLERHPGASKVVLRGSKGDVSFKLTDKLRAQILECYEYSSALQADRLAKIRREKYERMLATARDQLANLPLPDQGK